MAAQQWTTSLKLLSSNTSDTNFYTNGMYQLSSGTNINAGLYYTPQPGFIGGVTDPLSRGMQQQAAPQPETPEQWLRRRVRETCWKPA